jgi:hypothetical protein
MTKNEYKELFEEDDAVGWLSIDHKLEEIYGETEPRHYAPPLHYAVGGEDPIDGTSIFDSEKGGFHRHIISYGMSELYYNADKLDEPFSKWGFEFTMRIKPFEGDKEDPLWAIQVMNNLARYVYSSGRWFEAYHFIPANGPIRLETDTDIVGIAFAPDPELGVIHTPHGEVSFLQMVGLTSKETAYLLEKKATTTDVEALINELRKTNPYLITDLNRKS